MSLVVSGVSYSFRNWPELYTVARDEELLMNGSSERLPVMLASKAREFESQLIRMGFQDLHQLAGSSLFLATLPEGWTARSAYESKGGDVRRVLQPWEVIRDHLGRVRIYVLAQEGFGCSGGLMLLATRIQIRFFFSRTESPELEPAIFGSVHDNTIPLYRTPPCLHLEETGMEITRALGEAWADKHFPEWRSPDAYWDVEDLKSLLR